jgi:5'-AMP-activated protein kinase regulatory gamma subunit
MSQNALVGDFLGGGNTTVLVKTEGQQFLLGPDPLARALSRLTDENDVFPTFMKVHKVYDIMPSNSKLVTFDTELLVRKAFFALVYNSVRAAPLWDSSRQQYVGMLTITDFINILLRHHDCDDFNLDLEQHQIRHWKEPLSRGAKPNFITIDVKATLFDAIKLFHTKKVHRLPILDPTAGNVLYILTHKRIFKFLNIFIKDIPVPRWMLKTPKELGIGTWSNIITIRRDAVLIDILRIFAQHRVSALPIVDDNDALVDIYAKFDVINIAAEKSYNDLEVNVMDALKHRKPWFEGVHHCNERDNLSTVIDELAKHEIHRMIITDDEKRVTGIVSLSDLLYYLVLKFAPDEEDRGSTTTLTGSLTGDPTMQVGPMETDSSGSSSGVLPAAVCADPPCDADCVAATGARGVLVAEADRSKSNVSMETS